MSCEKVARRSGQWEEQDVRGRNVCGERMRMGWTWERWEQHTDPCYSMGNAEYNSQLDCLSARVGLADCIYFIPPEGVFGKKRVRNCVSSAHFSHAGICFPRSAQQRVAALFPSLFPGSSGSDGGTIIPITRRPAEPTALGSASTLLRRETRERLPRGSCCREHT